MTDFEENNIQKAIIKLGIPAKDYDIQNNFGETDYVIDLFAEINKAYDNLIRQDKTRQDKTVFDLIDPCQDLIIAFFPCIYFCEKSQVAFYYTCFNYRKLNNGEKIIKILERERNRHTFYSIYF